MIPKKGNGIAMLQDRIAELEAEVEKWQKLYSDWEATGFMDAAKIVKLRQAFEEYGQHLAGCDKLIAPMPDGVLAYGGDGNPDEECTCGLDALKGGE